MLIFEKVTYSNFLSFGQMPTVIHLNSRPRTLIVGNNGGGKSCLLDAITYALFGKPFRQVQLPQLINSINQRDCVVTIEFSKNGKQYKIVRGIKPNIMEIYADGEMIDQEAQKKDYQKFLEKSILGFTYKSFTQVVILGSSTFIPFMQLTKNERRLIIEDLLDIGIFSKMNSELKRRAQETKEEMRSVESQISLLEEKIESHKKILEIGKQHKEEKIESSRKDLEKTCAALDAEEQQIAEIRKGIESEEALIQDQDLVRGQIRKARSALADLRSKIAASEINEKFYEENDSCPTCRQIIDDAFREAEKARSRAGRTEYENLVQTISEALDKKEKRLGEIDRVRASIDEQQNRIRLSQGRIQSYSIFANQIKSSILEMEKKPDSSEADADQADDLAKKMADLRAHSAEILSKSRIETISQSILKDGGIKAVIIGQYIPIINKLVNKYLMAMDFFVNFTLSEQFEETVRSRYRDVFSYESFSEGEKQRIDLALLFTWREIARMKNSLNTNLLILDEVLDSSLDSFGMEAFLGLLSEMPHKTNLFVISHRGDTLVDKGFDAMIKFRKRKNYSEIDIGDFAGVQAES